LSSVERTGWISARFAHSTPARNRLNPKAQRDVWRTVNDAGLAPRSFKKKPDPGIWGVDRSGQDVGNYSLDKFEERTAKRVALTLLQVGCREFRDKRERARRGVLDPLTKDPVVLTEDEEKAEKGRRKEMAALRQDLYGERAGRYAGDPQWDDVVPIPQDEPEKALAAIAYPKDYAEGACAVLSLSASDVRPLPAQDEGIAC
jgi:protein farnesyltransferase/geranylgeranyltransferase type-1 subunit alpha